MREDLQTAVRSLRHAPTFSIVAVVVLALGIGAGTATFSVVDAVVLRGLPFDGHDRIVALVEHDPKQPTRFGDTQTTPQTYLEWRRLQQTFEGLAAVKSSAPQVRNEHGEPDSARAQRVTWEFFPTLRAVPLLGRVFSPQDELEGRHRVVILSYGFWQRRFGASPDVVGQKIDLNQQPYEIVGVMPRRFAYPVAAERPTELYLPIAFRKDERIRSGGRVYELTVLGRLRPGMTIDQAGGDMNRIAAALEKEDPAWSLGWRVRVMTLHEHLVGQERSWMLMLLGAVGAVLLIACANVANLMLARATVRRREIGVRATLGASRWRLVRGLLIEGLVLSIAGGAIGVILAYGGVRILRAWLPPELPRIAAITIDLRVLGAAVATTLVTALSFSVVPALQSSRPDLTRLLREDSRASTAGPMTQRLRHALVVAELALSVVLLVAAGLFVASFIKLMRIEPGFNYKNVLALNVAVPWQPGKFDEAMKQGRSYVQEMLAAVSRVPGVHMAGAVSGGLPLTGSWNRNKLVVPGGEELTGQDAYIDTRAVSPGYLDVLRVPLLKGRHLTHRDTARAQPVMVINQIAARKYFPDREAIGERVTVNNRDRVIVGIVGDIRHLGPEEPARQEAYLPIAQDDLASAALVMRTTDRPTSVLPAVKAAIWSVNPEQRIATDLVTLEQHMDRLIAQRRFSMALLTLFGALGLVIAAAGLYGVMTYTVAQRTREIGIRIALGATRGRIVNMVIGRATALTVVGLAVGAAGAWFFLSAGVKAFLFQIDPNDGRVFVAALATLAITGIAASAAPARRAAAVDPVVALRHD